MFVSVDVCECEREKETARTKEGEMELLLWGVCVVQSVYSIKCKHGVPVLIYVSGQAGGRVSQCGGADMEWG